MDTFDDSTTDTGCTCGCCCYCSPEVATYDEPDFTEPEPLYAEPAYTQPEPVYTEPVAVEPIYTEPVYTEPSNVQSVPATPVVLPAPHAPLVGGSNLGDALHTEATPTFGPTIMGGFSAISATDPTTDFGPTIMGGFSAISATDPAPDFGPTIMGGFSAIGAADPGPGFGPMIVGGETAASHAHEALSDDLERIAAVRDQFGNTPPNPVAAAEQAQYPGVVLNQIGILHQSAQNADETAIYGSRITNPYD